MRSRSCAWRRTATAHRVAAIAVGRLGKSDTTSEQQLVSPSKLSNKLSSTITRPLGPFSTAGESYKVILDWWQTSYEIDKSGLCFLLTGLHLLNLVYFNYCSFDSDLAEKYF